LVTVFTIAVALAGGATEAGLTTQVGKAVMVSFDVAWHERSTVPLNPFVVPSVRLDVASPPGSTVPLPENVVICRVNPACPDAHGIPRKRTNTNETRTPPCGLRNLKMDVNDSNLNMSRFLVQVASIHEPT
jgi:hypothetical protein